MHVEFPLPSDISDKFVPLFLTFDGTRPGQFGFSIFMACQRRNYDKVRNGALATTQSNSKDFLVLVYKGFKKEADNSG
jgi:hypothetical protein